MFGAAMNTAHTSTAHALVAMLARTPDLTFVFTGGWVFARTGLRGGWASASPAGMS